MFSQKSFSQRISEQRKAKAITQQALAEAVGLKKQAINMIEKEQRACSIEVLCALADYFNVSIDYLVGRSDCPIVIKNEHIMMLSPEEQQRILKDRKKADS